MTAQRMQLGTFHDDGEICGAALLYHYDAGTSTEKTIWADAAQTQELAQPFEADADGVFNFFATGNYKFIVKKADGTELYSLDNWAIGAASSGVASLAGGVSVVTASFMDLAEAVWAHWTGSNNVSTLSGSAPFYWAMADGSFTLIHSASLVMPDGRNRKVLSGDVLFFINEGAGVFRLGGHMQTEGGWTGRMGTSVAASATLAIPTDGDFIDVSGGTTITAVATAPAGYRFRARFTGTGLNITHNATSLIAPWAADYRTVQNEVLEFLSLGSGNWLFFSLNGPPDPTGKIVDFGQAAAPPGYLSADGTAVSRTTYSGLFQKYSTTHGAGDGSTTFNLPDARGRTRIMVDGAANRVTSASTGGANADTLGGTGGAQTHTLTLSESPVHDHEKTLSSGALSNSDEAGATNTSSVKRTDFAVRSAGGGGAHSNTQPWIAVNVYVRF